MVRRSARIETKLTPKLWSREEDDDDYERPELRTPEYSQRENIHRSPFGPRIEDKLRILGLRSTRRADLEQTDRSRFFSRLKHLSGDLEASRRKEEERRIDSDVELRSLEVLDEDNDGPVFYSFGDLASREDEYGYLNGENASDDDSTVSPEEEHFEGSPSPVQQQVSPPGSNQRGPAAYHVIKSLYAGDGYEGGHHSAKLTAVLSDRAVISQSMFRWIHFARSSMDIDDFSAQVALIPGLSSAETAGLRSMIASIKRDNVLKVQVSDGNLAKSVKGLTPSPARPSLFRDKTLGEYFINLEHQILHKTSLGDGSAYRATEAMERSAVHKLLESERQRLYETYSPKQQRDFNRRVALFLLADAVFNFFFPQDMLGITTSGKFWGAVARLVMPESSETPEANATLSDSKKSNVAEVPRPSWRSNLDLLESFLGALREDIFAFTEIFASIEEPDREYIKTPPTLTNAWVHIILALATFPHNQERSLQLADRARSEVNDGMGEIIAARSEPLDVCNLVMLPSDMVALMCLKLTDNPTPNMPHIFSVYGSYLRMIESEIDTAPDRKIEIKLRLLRQELGAIRSVVVVTANDVHFIATKRSEPTSWFSVRLPADGTMESMAEGILGPDRYGNPNPCGFSYILLRDCLSELRAMVYELSRTTEAVERLSTVNRERIGETKDRQERAIYAFTMVTVVFLPLSAVASIFGMNSSDIRDMELGQWAYWATALPVTAAVMVLGLLVTGDLEVAHRWFEQRISRPRGKVTWETDSGEK
ncbi:hypothetical protein MYCTH_2128378 [Thermothelomyces thermophilus ATCC 42464]|uniref:Uncharacterized protein n=1 Tax=Thermothelomyces thermophilus (strain ATCC 42464 / BCRC 31852 / DSM 1799) TaxID=573729 RepID=G2QG11_THET4|nr:uncharacterized protein MYCTH_2128378 [Thermothelomyces thermophilus ATCC 42464]AEO59324.1 hypothetical protein MYCTH_2128378 [Thermothelomyces thermophilus ATCC 42464]